MADLCANGCGRQLGERRRRKTDFCQKCAAAATARDPAKLAKCQAAMLERFQEPGYARSHGAAVSRGLKLAKRGNPAERERRRENGRRMSAMNVGRKASDETRERMSRALSERFLAGIPLEYRDEYKRMVKNKSIPAVDARRIILEQCERDTAEFLRTGKLPVHG